jgi:hypothetical protein
MKPLGFINNPVHTLLYKQFVQAAIWLVDCVRHTTLSSDKSGAGAVVVRAICTN